MPAGSRRPERASLAGSSAATCSRCWPEEAGLAGRHAFWRPCPLPSVAAERGLTGHTLAGWLLLLSSPQSPSFLSQPTGGIAVRRIHRGSMPEWRRRRLGSSRRTPCRRSGCLTTTGCRPSTARNAGVRRESGASGVGGWVPGKNEEARQGRRGWQAGIGERERSRVPGGVVETWHLGAAASSFCNLFPSFVSAYAQRRRPR